MMLCIVMLHKFFHHVLPYDLLLPHTYVRMYVFILYACCVPDMLTCIIYPTLGVYVRTLFDACSCRPW